MKTMIVVVVFASLISCSIQTQVGDGHGRDMNMLMSDSDADARLSPKTTSRNPIKNRVLAIPLGVGENKFLGTIEDYTNDEQELRSFERHSRFSSVVRKRKTSSTPQLDFHPRMVSATVPPTTTSTIFLTEWITKNNN